MKSSGPTKGEFRKNPYIAIAHDAVASPGEWQETEKPGLARSALSQAHYAAAGMVFTVSQRDGIMYIRYDGPAEKDTT